MADPTRTAPMMRPWNYFGSRATAEQVTEGIDLTGKVYLVTGMATGLGLESARVLLMRGAHVVCAARSVERASNALGTLKGVTVSEATTTCVACDLADAGSVRGCVDTVKQVLGAKKLGELDCILCNAGIMALPKLELVEGKYEKQFFTNHMGHFILVNGLLPVLGDHGRVVALSSTAHRMAPSPGIPFDNLDGSKGYGAWPNYGISKLANLLFAKELTKHLPKPTQRAYSLHPGVIKTELGRHMNGFIKAVLGFFAPIFLKSIPQGAATQMLLATHPSIPQSANGCYFADSQLVTPSQWRGLSGPAKDEELATRLWELSVDIASKV